MSRKKPNIITPYDTKGQSNDFIQNIFDDMFISHHTPNSLSLDGILITLTLSDKKFLDEELKIDSSSDYVDIYLQTVKQKASSYEIAEVGNNIVVTFLQAIVDDTSGIVAGDFQVRGKIVSR